MPNMFCLMVIVHCFCFGKQIDSWVILINKSRHQLIDEDKYLYLSKRNCHLILVGWYFFLDIYTERVFTNKSLFELVTF